MLKKLFKKLIYTEFLKSLGQHSGSNKVLCKRPPASPRRERVKVPLT
jgi:hypothetical protein